MDMIPRGPVQTGDQDKLDYADGYLEAMRRWKVAAMDQAVRFRNMCPESRRLKVYTKYIEGDHWDQFGKTPSYRSKFYINKTGAARVSHLALMTDTRPSVEIKSVIPEYEQYSSMLESIIGNEWTTGSLDLKLAMAADIASVTGTGFWKIGAAAPGMTRVLACGPDMVMPIQPGFDIQESVAVASCIWRPLAAMAHKYPHLRKKLEQQASFGSSGGMRYAKPDYMDDVTWQGTAPALQVIFGRRVDTESMSASASPFRAVEATEIYVDDYSVNESSQEVIVSGTNLALEDHNWWYRVKPGGRLYPRKRLVKFLGDEVVYDGPSPFWHGLYPFPTLRLNPVFWSFWGLSKYRDMLPINSAMNRIVAGILDTIAKALNPVTIGVKGKISDNAWKAFFPDVPGAKLQLEGIGSNPSQDVKFSDPPQLPSYVLEMLGGFLGPEFDKIVGAVDVSALGGKKQVPGGDTLEQMRDSLQTPLRLEGRMTEVFIRDAAIQAVSNVLQFYTPKRVREITGVTPPSAFIGELGSLLPKEMGDAGNKFDFWRSFPLRVVPGSMHGGAKDRRKLMMMNLAAAGKISRKLLLEELEIVDPYWEEEQAQMAQAMQMQQEQQGMMRLSRGQRNGNPF